MLRSAFKIISIYFIFGTLWFLVSFNLKDLFPFKPETLQRTAMISVILFIFISTVLIFLLVQYHFRAYPGIKKKSTGKYPDEKSLRLFFDYFNDAAYVYELGKDNVPGKFLDVNQKMVEQLGYTKEELLKMHPYEILAPGVADIIKKTEYQLLTTRHHYLEIDHVNNLGKKFPVEVSLHLFDTNGSHFVFGTVKDIREQKKYIRKLRKAKEKAEESDRLKSAFLSNMSHEIRTPMNGIIGFSELIVQNGIDDEQRTAYSGLIKRCTVQLLNIVNDILDISKIETHQMTLVESACSLNSIIDYLYNDLKEKVSGKENIDISYSKSFANGSDIIIADQNRLHQVLNNLINNAEKFTISGTIDFGYVLEENTMLKFWVKDSGIGIPDDKLLVVFEHFRQADDTNTREFGGTGLGLAIAKGIVEQMGGVIHVDSKIGEGTTIIFTIPYKKSEPNSIVQTAMPVKKSDLKGKTILIVEDSVENSLLLEEIAKLFNVAVVKAFTGSEAISYLYQNNNIDLIFLDIRLPDISGIEVVTSLKDIITVPIVAQTAYASVEDKANCLSAGCSDYISKPVTRTEFERMLFKYLS